MREAIAVNVSMVIKVLVTKMSVKMQTNVFLVLMNALKYVSIYNYRREILHKHLLYRYINILEFALRQYEGSLQLFLRHWVYKNGRNNI